MLPPLLRKEFAWGRRKVFVLVFLFVLLPGAFVYGTLAFQTVIPADAPVAVVPASEDTGGDDLAIARGAVTPFSKPVSYESESRAFEALDRERVYAVVSVPANVTDSGETAVFDVYVSGSIVPYHEASKAVVGVLNVVLNQQLPAGIDVQVERHIVGEERSLSTYLVPTFLLALAMLVALAYLPYNLSAERAVLDRLRVESSLTRVLGWKLAFFGGLLVVPLAVFHVAADSFGYGVSLLTPGALVVYALTFCYLGAVGLSITLLTRFSTWGRLLNVLVLFFLLLFSGLLYPAGFFSPLRRELVRAMPTYYSSVAMRGFVLRDADLSFFAPWLLGLAGVALASLLVLRGSVAVYERRAN